MRKGIKFLFIPLVYASNQTPSPHRVVHPFIFDLRATSSYPFQYSISHKRENGRNTHLNRGLFALFGMDNLCNAPEEYTTIWGEKLQPFPREDLLAKKSKKGSTASGRTKTSGRCRTNYLRPVQKVVAWNCAGEQSVQNRLKDAAIAEDFYR